MRRTGKVTAGILTGLLCFAAVAGGLSRNQAHGGQASSQRENAPTQDGGRDRAALAKGGGMSSEEKTVRDVYARLMRYHTAARDEASANRGVIYKAEDYITFGVNDVKTGLIEEIVDRPLSELVTPRDGEVINLKPNYLRGPDGLAHASYDALWATLSQVKKPDQTTALMMLQASGEKYKDAVKYTSYEVTVSLEGKRRTYRATALHFNPGAADNSVTTEILDNITSNMNIVLMERSPRVRSPWARYVKSDLYNAIVSSVREKVRAGLPLIPADAPIGYLPGDDTDDVEVANSALAITADACEPPPEVSNLQVSMPSTKNPLVSTPPAPGTVSITNLSLTFASATSPDLVAVFQSSTVKLKITANVNPTSAGNQLSWRVDRDGDDTVANNSVPSLSANSGASVDLTPNTAGNFRVICYYDTNSNGSFNNGEELRVLRIAVVRATLIASVNNSAIDSGGLKWVGSNYPNGEYALDSILPVPPPEMMLLRCLVLLEGGGANRTIGVSLMKLGNVGNLTRTSAKVNYGASRTGTETLPSGPGEGAPMVDSPEDNPSGGSTPFRGNSNDTPSNPPNGNGKYINVNSLDLPGFGPYKAVNGVTWTSTQGGYDFTEFIVGYSNSFTKYYVAFAKATWSVTAIGTNSGGTWVNNGSTLTLQGATYSQGATPSPQALTNLISDDKSPLSADAAGVQVLGKSYYVLANRRFTYTP